MQTAHMFTPSLSMPSHESQHEHYSETACLRPDWKVLKQTHGMQGAAKKSYTSKTEINKDAMKKAMRMNQLG